MDLPNADSFLWENFALSGLPAIAQELGSKKAWLRYRTEAEFRRALRADPDDLPTLHRYALFLYNKKKDATLAERMFQRCLQIREDYVEALIDYGVMCWLRWRMADADRKDILDKHKAERLLRRAVKLVSGKGTLQARAMSKLALFVDSALGQKDEAMVYFRRAAECDPANPDHPHNLAVHLEEAGRFDEAAAQYKAAIAANALHGPALSNYARLLYRHYRDKESALKFHQRAVRAMPYDPEICFNYALFQEEAMRHYGWAKDFYDRAVAGGSKDPSIYITAASFYLRRLRDKGKCMELHRTALRLDHDHVPSLLSYAHLLEFDRKDISNAASYYQRALEVKEAEPEAAAEALSEAARFMQDKCAETEKARQAVQRALERRPASAGTLTTCARLVLDIHKDQDAAMAVFTASLERTDLTSDQRFEIHLAAARFIEAECEGMEEKAGEHYREALRLRPEDPRGIAAYAGLLAGFYSDPVLADKYYRQAIKLEPGNPEALLGYARFINDVKKQPLEAEHYFGKAVKADESSSEALAAFARFLAARAADARPADADELLKRALGLYRQAVERAHDDAELHRELAEFVMEEMPGYSEMRAGQYVTAASLAEEQLVLAVEAAPRDPGYLVALAEFLAERGRRPSDADALFQQALKMDPDRAETLGSYAVFLEETVKDKDGAEQMYLRAITASPRDAAYLHNYATFLEDKRKDYDKADEYLLRAVEADPEDPQICRAYAELLSHHLRDKKRAKPYLARAEALEAAQDARQAHPSGGGKRAGGRKRKAADPSVVPLLHLRGSRRLPAAPNPCAVS